MNLAHRIALVVVLVALTLGSLFVLLASLVPREVTTPGWSLDDFIGHLRAHEIELTVISTRQSGALGGTAYLTEDPDETWESFQRKIMLPEYVHQWRGSVWVGRRHSVPGADWLLRDWGNCGCRIGDFLLFGDERLLRRIQQTFR